MFRWFLLSALVGCKDRNGETGGAEAWRPDLVCPGDEGCESLGDGILYAGAAAVAITPTCFESWEDADGDGEHSSSDEVYFDCGCDQLCEGDEGWVAPDEGEEDGAFQAAYIAGFGMNRPATGVHDDIWARTVVFRQGDVTVALVSVDLIGIFYNEVLDVRQQVKALGLDVDHVIVSSTHNHEGPDTLGQWGRTLGRSGYDPAYVETVRENIVQSISESIEQLTAATVRVAAVDTSLANAEQGSRNVVYDHRDPKIIDRFMGVAHVVDDSEETIATLINYGNHPEALGSANTLITSDFSDALRRGVEDGITGFGDGLEGVGGVCLFINASVGGLMSPLRVDVIDLDGTMYSDASFEKSDALGRVLASMALEGVSNAAPLESTDLAIRSRNFFLPIDNVAFQAAFLLDMFSRPVYGVDTAEMDFQEDTPELLTGVDVFDIGDFRMLTVPGELLPELAIGGYDDENQPYTSLETMVEEGNENPPDLSLAPSGSPLKTRMGSTHNWIIGLGNDEVGYIIPPYNFKLHEATPYLQEAPGHHYEETNSLGPETAPIMEAAVIELLDWREE